MDGVDVSVMACFFNSCQCLLIHPSLIHEGVVMCVSKHACSCKFNQLSLWRDIFALNTGHGSFPPQASKMPKWSEPGHLGLSRTIQDLTLTRAWSNSLGLLDLAPMNVALTLLDRHSKPRPRSILLMLQVPNLQEFQSSTTTVSGMA